MDGSYSGDGKSGSGEHGRDRRSGGDRRLGDDRRVSDRRSVGDRRRSPKQKAQANAALKDRSNGLVPVRTLVFRSFEGRRTGEDRRTGCERRSGEDRREGAVDDGSTLLVGLTHHRALPAPSRR